MNLIVPDSVVEVRRIPAMTAVEHHRRRFARPVRKALHFLRKEGPAATLRKIRTKRLERRIEAAQAVIVAALEDGRIGFTRDIGGSLRFHPRLIFGADRHPVALESVVVPAEALAALEAYLPVPSCPVPEGLPDQLREANPGLHPAEPPPSSRAGRPARRAPSVAAPPTRATGRASRAEGGVYLLGFGGYIRDHVLPHLGDRVVAAVDYKAGLITELAPPGFPVHADLEAVADRIADDPDPLVIVATYHSDHAPLALRLLELNARARVFIEKPAAVEAADAARLLEARRSGAWIDVGYNRRYAPLTPDLLEAARRLPRPLLFSATVEEIRLPPGHWYLWPNQGTRITGNACHWLDLALYVIGSPPTAVEVVGEDEACVIAVRFADGSLASILTTDRGDDLSGVTERIELRGGNGTVLLDDFHRLTVSEDGRRTVRRARWHDKGHDAMYRDLRERWLAGAEPRYPAEAIVQVTELTERASGLLGPA